MLAVCIAVDIVYDPFDRLDVISFNDNICIVCIVIMQ